MSGAGDESEELGGGVEKVEDLRHEEEKESLAEVAQNADHGKCHPGKVAVRVAHKDPGWIPGGGITDRTHVQDM